MSDNDQYLDMFFAESRDYIQMLNDNILQLEENPENKEVINSLFRAAHSLKGMSATMGFNTLTELTHKLENMMDKIRNGEIVVDTEIIDLLFAGIDHIENIVAQIKENGNEDIDIDGFLKQLEKQISVAKNRKPEEKEEKPAELGLELSSEEIENIRENKKELDTVYQIKVLLADETEFKQARASMIFKSASELGYIVKSEPKKEEIAEVELENNKI